MYTHNQNALKRCICLHRTTSTCHTFTWTCTFIDDISAVYGRKDTHPKHKAFSKYQSGKGIEMNISPYSSFYKCFQHMNTLDSVIMTPLLWSDYIVKFHLKFLLNWEKQRPNLRIKTAGSCSSKAFSIDLAMHVYCPNVEHLFTAMHHIIHTAADGTTPPRKVENNTWNRLRLPHSPSEMSSTSSHQRRQFSSMPVLINMP